VTLKVYQVVTHGQLYTPHQRQSHTVRLGVRNRLQKLIGGR